jgi:LacI family transcriptional regulator
VNCDDEGGAYAAARFLAGRHREVLILGFPGSAGGREGGVWGVEARRLRGYHRAFEERGLPWSPYLVVPSAVSPDGGERAFARAFERLRSTSHPPTAVLAASDAAAFGVLRAAGRMGLRVPEDLEVIGFDDVPLAALSNPPLSTVRQPIEKKGRMAAGLLLDLIEHRPVTEPELLPIQLVLRGTTG